MPARLQAARKPRRSRVITSPLGRGMVLRTLYPSDPVELGSRQVVSRSGEIASSGHCFNATLSPFNNAISSSDSPGRTSVHAAGERFTACDERLNHRSIDENAKRIVWFELRRQCKGDIAAGHKAGRNIDRRVPRLFCRWSADGPRSFGFDIAQRDVQFSAQCGQRLLDGSAGLQSRSLLGAAQLFDFDGRIDFKLAFTDSP